MISFGNAGIMLAVMAITTYLIRVTPMALFHHKIENRWFRNFMFYIPFCVLSAMTFPEVIYSTQSMTSGIVATVAALVMSWRKRDLLVVAIGAVVAAVLTELIIGLNIIH